MRRVSSSCPEIIIFRLQIPQIDMVDFDLCAVLQVESRFGLKILQMEEWTALKNIVDIRYNVLAYCV